ncbi:MAG: aldehyde dehydrogenase family protein [Desulfobacterales bacterium]|nr:MAG: aldehyde dehydrogenase family protein [Desulfobacterales bacterium]
MATNGYKMYINGEWVGKDETFADYNPANGVVWAEIPNGTREDAKKAVEAAAAAQPEWAALPHSARAGYLLKAADILERRQTDFVNALIEEGGGWIGKGMFESGYTPGIFRAAAAAVYQMTGEILPSEHGKISMVIRKPLGVVSVISPWNFPLLLSSRGLAVALAVGNAVVLKPSEETPVAGGILIAELFEEAGLPKGVFNVVTCARENVADVGDELVANPLVGGVSFTGSTAVGRQVASKAGQMLKKVCVELGGKDSLIVLDDADMELALNAATFGTFMHQGQICMSVEKIIVDEAVAAEFTERFVAKVKTLKVGDPREMPNVIGPIINQRQLDKIHAQVTDAVEKGAQLLAGGKFEGLFYQPTVLTGITPEMRIYQEETFGPVAPIITVKGVDEAVAVANDSEYGLSAGIITRDEEKGLAVANRLQTGMAHVNDSSVNDEPHVPFGGVKNSGVGRHGGRASVETFTELRWLTLERGGRHYPPPFVVEPRG